MRISEEFQGEQEFPKLLARRSDVDLTIAALEIARDFDPQADFNQVHRWIEERAREVRQMVCSVGAEPMDIKDLHALVHCLAEVHGLGGDADAFDRPESSFLHRVIATGRGIPISLSLVYMAVGGRVYLDLQGVASPMHFLTRFDAVDGPYFLDAFRGGVVMSQPECLDWLAELTGLERTQIEPTLRPARPRNIVIRVLNNLKILYSRQEQWPEAWLAQRRLTALIPSDYAQRRDLALLSLRTDRPGPAVDLLERCLKSCPDDERELLENSLTEANRRLAKWN